MKLHLQGLRRVIVRLGTNFLAKEYEEARKRWLQGFRGGLAWLSIPITAIGMYALWPWAFGQGFLFGLSFLTGAILAILRGHIFTHPFRLILVAVAVVIGSLVIPGLRGDAWQALRGGDVVGAVAIVGVGFLLWRLKGQMETGQIDHGRSKTSKRSHNSRR